MKSFSRVALAVASIAFVASPVLAAPAAAKLSPSLALKAAGTDLRAGKSMKRSNKALAGVPLVLVIAAGVAATAVVVNEVASDDSDSN